MATLSLDWMVEDAHRLAECRHDHPFAVLGPQPLDGGGWVVRAWVPEAERVALLHGGQSVPMDTPNHPWVFEARLDQDPGSTYQLQVLRAGMQHTQHDPWAFRGEWMGELDRLLFAEGNHHHIWRKMGAHLTERDGVAGVMFCLWAPNARSVAVLGNFNNWDGRLHPMQSRLGGCWELFIPGVAAGEIYKYEIRTQQGHCYQKADPYGFRHEVRPANGSIIEPMDQGRYPWSDRSWMAERDSRNPLEQPIAVYEMHLGSWMHAGADAPYIEPDGTAPAQLPRAGRQTDPVREGPRLHPHRTAADLGAPL